MQNSSRYSVSQTNLLMKGHEDGGLMFCGRYEALPDTRSGAFGPYLRKEVIQPQVPLRLPCYDFTPVAEPTVVACFLLLGWRNAFG